MENTAIATRSAEIAPRAMADYALSPQEVLKQASLVQQVMAAVMKDGEHYGVIPGTSGKKSLLKSGAEKLAFVFGLSNKLEIESKDLPGGHREIQIICNLFDRSGNLRGQGVGCASTMESKHRYRGAGGKACPSCGASSCKASKKEYGGGYYCDSKSGGCNARFKPGSKEVKELDLIPAVRQENTDPADQYNTVLKMAKKRALVDSILTATACSDLFAQDLEDLEDKIDHEEEKVAHAKKVNAEPPATASLQPQKTDQPKLCFFSCVDCGEVITETEKPANCRKCNSTQLNETATLEGAQRASHAVLGRKAQEAAKAKKNAEQHNGIKVAMELFGLLPADSRTKILMRLNGLFGAKKVQDIVPEKMENYEKRASQLLMLFRENGIDALLDNLSLMETNEAQKEEAPV